MEPLDSGLHVAGLTEFLAQPTAGAGADLGPGTRLGDVTIVRLVAEGGMGRVYEGLQGMPCRTVAVKVIRPGVLSPAAMRRFEHEAQILGRLTHPGIARIYTLATTSLGGMHLPYFVMEFVEDALSITDYARDRSLGMRDRVSLFRDACRAVAYGHGKGVIHRDLKPGNILVDAAGHAKVIDFGVARTTDVDVARTTMHTDVGQLVGTLQYMSPEQFEGEVDELDVRADVYALGVVLYELLAGRPPYELARRPVYEAARVVREEEPKSLAAVHPMCRGDLATIVAKCMEKDRSRRYTSAAEVEADLGRYLRGESISASPRGLGDGLRRLARRHRLAAAAAAASLVRLWWRWWGFRCSRCGQSGSDASRWPSASGPTPRPDRRGSSSTWRTCVRCRTVSTTAISARRGTCMRRARDSSTHPCRWNSACSGPASTMRPESSTWGPEAWERWRFPRMAGSWP